MRHFAGRAFWEAYNKLPKHIRELADKNFALLKANPSTHRFNSKRLDASGRRGSAYDIAHLLSKPRTTLSGFGSARTRITMRCLSEFGTARGMG